LPAPKHMMGGLKKDQLSSIKRKTIWGRSELLTHLVIKVSRKNRKKKPQASKAAPG